MVNAIIRSILRSFLLNAIMVEMSTRVRLTKRVVENHTPSQVHVGLNKLKIQEHKPLNGNWDVKELENFIFDVQQYLRLQELAHRTWEWRWPQCITWTIENYGGARRWMVSKMDHAPYTHGKIIDGIDAIDAPLDGLSIKDLTFDVDAFEERATRSNSSKRRGSSENSITHMEERVEDLDIIQKIMLKLFSDRTKNKRTIIPKIHCRPTVKIFGFQPSDLGLIPRNGFLFSYSVLFYCFIFRRQLYLNFTYVWDIFKWGWSDSNG